MVSLLRKKNERTISKSCMKSVNVANCKEIDDSNFEDISRDDELLSVASSKSERVETTKRTVSEKVMSPLMTLKRSFSRDNGEVFNSKVIYDEFGDNIDTLCYTRTEEADLTPLSETDVVVKVKASSCTLKDCNIVRGIWYESVTTPNTPGFDIVGTIHSLGTTVEEEGLFKVGDPVAACVRTGGNARFCNVASKDLIRVPGVVDSAQAVSLVSTYMTAYQALHRVKPTKEKETLEGTSVLITGGNGPIGTAAIELAIRAGCSKVYTTASEKYHQTLKSKGAIVLPLDADEWLPTVEGKMDLVIDGICQDDYASPRAALNSTGHLVVVGMTMQTNKQTKGYLGMPSNALWSSVKANYLMTKTTTYCPWQSSQAKPSEFKHDLEYIFGLLQRGKIKPKIGKRVILEQVPKTMKQMEMGEIDGIVVCKPWK